MPPFQPWKNDTLSPTNTPTLIGSSDNSTLLHQGAADAKNGLTTALAVVGTLATLCALLVAILQLRATYQKRQTTQEIGLDLVVLDANSIEVGT
jgi:hypothetical protein